MFSLSQAIRVGIDLKSTNPTLAYWDERFVRVVDLAWSFSETESIMRLSKKDCSATLGDLLEIIGMEFEETEKRLDQWPFEVVQEEGRVTIRAGRDGKTVEPHEILAMVLT